MALREKSDEQDGDLEFKEAERLQHDANYVDFVYRGLRSCL